MPPRSRRIADNQLALPEPPNVAISATWPDARRFPHNEEGSVAGVVLEDLREAENVLVVTGYASLSEIVRLLSSVTPGRTRPLRILFGAEPFLPASGRPVLRKELSQEMREYWSRRGFSPQLSGAVLHACTLASRRDVEVRIGTTSRPVHAKLYVSERAATLGSSNFTHAGLHDNREANVRFIPGTQPDRRRHAEIRSLAEGFWATGRDFTAGFIDLLEELAHVTSWQETLARGCALLLEGDWARDYVQADTPGSPEKKLWPHQLQGIAQALWILEHTGSVLVADATGSGKTLLGAWLLRAAYDQRIGRGHRPHLPLLIAPPSVTNNWNKALNETGLPWNVRSHGSLSNEKAARSTGLEQAIRSTELLAIDEAHNFVNNTRRTRRLIAHQAEQALLFTATPINRKASDVLALVELLGADNFSDAALERLNALRRASSLDVDDTELLRKEIQRFTVRRTRAMLNRIAEEHADAYRSIDGRSIRYPQHRSSFFPCEALPGDNALAQEIADLASRLHGVLRIGRKLQLPVAFRQRGVGDSRYLQIVTSSAAALSRFHVMKCLRSSRAALLEHIEGTAAAWRTFAPAAAKKTSAGKQETGNLLASLKAAAGKPPEWKLDAGAKSAAPAWMYDEKAHEEACAHDAELYGRIASLVRRMSDAREEAKLAHLRLLHERLGSVIAFDSHVITLELFEEHLADLPARCFTGQGGASAKRRAIEALGLESDGTPIVALCSDALSEGINLQGASCVVHLDTPTVVRIAEQRAGRVDRMNSPHAEVEIWWPKDPAAFAPQRRDMLRERHELVSDLIGANLELPSDDPAPLGVEELATEASIDKTEAEVRFADAFQPVRDLVGEGGLVEPALYRRMRGSQLQLRTCVSYVAGKRPWAFFAVGTARNDSVRWAPRWVFFDGTEAKPILGLDEIAEKLRERLGPDAVACESVASDELVESFLRALRKSERELLPLRRRRALDQLERMLECWAKKGWSSDTELPSAVRAIQLALWGNAESRIDLRLAADAWLELLRPRIRAALEQRHDRGKLFRLAELDASLSESPIPAAELRAAFESLPQLPPIEERVEALIVGVPEGAS